MTTWDEEDSALVSATLTFADTPETEHVIDATIEPDETLDGAVVATGTADDQPFTEPVNLAEWTYRPDGNGDHPNRALDEPPGLAASSMLPAPELRWTSVELALALLVLLVAAGALWFGYQIWTSIMNLGNTTPVRPGVGVPGGS